MNEETNVKELSKRKKAMFSVKTMPFFMGLSNDLIFYIAINTIFLTTVKQLTASQISFLTTVSFFCYIVLQRPFLKIINKIGNTKSVRIGTIILLLGSIILTFGKSYCTVMLGQVLYAVSYLFKSMDNVMLKNNLAYLGKQDDYIKYKNKANIAYSIYTTITALSAGHLFNINHYLPMYLGIAVCLINVFISFKLNDENDSLTENIIDREEKKVNFTSLILLIMFSYGIFYATISTGQTNVKLLTQYQLENYFEIGLTATYISYILVMSRITRVLSNISFYKVYDKVKDKVVYMLPALSGTAFVLVLVGSIVSHIVIKIILMSIGFCIILGIRDVFSTYMQDLLLKNVKHSEQQAGISYLGLSRKIGETSISFIFSLMLLKVELIYIIVSLIILSLISFIINFKLYKMVRSN